MNQYHIYEAIGRGKHSVSEKKVSSFCGLLIFWVVVGIGVVVLVCDLWLWAVLFFLLFAATRVLGLLIFVWVWFFSFYCLGFWSWVSLFLLLFLVVE